MKVVYVVLTSLLLFVNSQKVTCLQVFYKDGSNVFHNPYKRKDLQDLILDPDSLPKDFSYVKKESCNVEFQDFSGQVLLNVDDRGYREGYDEYQSRKFCDCTWDFCDLDILSHFSTHDYSFRQTCDNIIGLETIQIINKVLKNLKNLISIRWPQVSNLETLRDLKDFQNFENFNIKFCNNVTFVTAHGFVSSAENFEKSKY